MSSFQLHFADHDILTPGDAPDVLVAMNPAALKANLADLPRGGDLVVNTDEFTKRNLTRVGYETNPVEDDSLAEYHVHAIPLTSMTVKALDEFDITRKDAERAKNMFALGLLSWLYDRPVNGTLKFLEAKFASRPEIMKANIAAFQAGWNYGETTESFSVRYEIKPATLQPGTYRNITGNTALSYGLIAASQLSGLPLFLGSYPSPRPPTSCTSCPSTSGSGCGPSRPRTRSPGSARRWARRSAARWPSPRPRARA